MRSVFAFETIETARAFVAGFPQRSRWAMFEIEGTRLHRATMGLLNLPIYSNAGSTSFAAARAYWIGEEGSATISWELLLEPGARIGQMVEADDSVRG